jgi:hypothetical protein
VYLPLIFLLHICMYIHDLHTYIAIVKGYPAGGSLPCCAKNLVHTGPRDGSGGGFLPGFAGRMRVWDGSPSGRSRATPHMKCYFAYFHSSAPHKLEQQGTTLEAFLERIILSIITVPLTAITIINVNNYSDSCSAPTCKTSHIYLSLRVHVTMHCSLQCTFRGFC